MDTINSIKPPTSLNVFYRVNLRSRQHCDRALADLSIDPVPVASHHSIRFYRVCAMEPRRLSECSDQSTLPTLPPLAEVLHHDLLRLRCSSSSPSVTLPCTQPPNVADNIHSPLSAHNNLMFHQRQHAFLTTPPHSSPCSSIGAVHHQISPVRDGVPHAKLKRSLSHQLLPNSSYTFLISDPMSMAQANRPTSNKVVDHRPRHTSPKSTSSRAPFDTVSNNVGAKARHKAIHDRYTSHRSYEESLNQIKSLSRTLCEFAEAQGRPSPARLPRQHEVSHMLKNMETVKQLLQQFHAPLPSPDTESGRGTLQDIINASESLTRPQHVSERPTGPNLSGIRPKRCHICKKNNVHTSPPWEYRKENLCRACEFLRPRKETKRILRRGHPS